jgi:hypothetical protein
MCEGGECVASPWGGWCRGLQAVCLSEETLKADACLKPWKGAGKGGALIEAGCSCCCTC